MKNTTLLTILGAFGACALAFPLFASGSSNGIRTSEYSSGSPRERVAWVDGMRDGPASRWHRDGTLRAEGEYEAGSMTGEWSFYLADGSRDASKSGSYSNGRRIN